MSAFDPKVVEFSKRLCGPGQELELVRKTEWSYTFKCGAKSFCSISRFMAEEGFEVSAAEMRSRWPAMNDKERLDFACNFSCKARWNGNDTEILEIIMQDGDDGIWQSCALAMLRHPDRERVVQFLIERVQRYPEKKPPLNYVQALGLAKDRRATAAIMPYYEKCREAMETEKVTGIPDDIFWGPIPYHAYLSICGDLLKIEGSPEYEQSIRKYLDHPHEQVRLWAEYALEIEGPATLKRRAEYEKKRAQE